MLQSKLSRRNLLKTGIVLTAGVYLSPKTAQGKTIATFEPVSTLKGLIKEDVASPIPGAIWYTAQKTQDGLLYRFEKGMLTKGKYLVSDFLADGNHMIVFNMLLQEGENGPKFGLDYRGLSQAQARIRLPLAMTDLNRWMVGRESAWLKPMCGGERVNLENVDRILIIVQQKSSSPARWCQTPIQLVDEEPAKITDPILPKGKLMDEMGQSTIHDWPEKTKNVEELKKQLQKQLEEAPAESWPSSFTRWGGCKEKKLKEGSGFFTTHHDGKRWWLVDPDGFAFWSTGMDCTGMNIDMPYSGLEKAMTWLPEATSEFSVCIDPNRKSVNFHKANFIRAFGPEKWQENWATITLSQLRHWGVNTVGNWSDWQIAKKAKFPYVIPLGMHLSRSKMLYRDFPDVFHSDFKLDAQDYAQQLKENLDDPALIGYFLMNEPTWSFSTETPAAGMLFNSPSCASRKFLAKFLQERYGDNEKLSKAWEITTTLEAIAEGKWTTPLTAKAKEDLTDFSERMVEIYFTILSDECKKVDPHHLNLGVRYYTVPHKWAVKGMKKFDVFSMNCYKEKIPIESCKEIHELLNQPTIIGEFHFGALDVGLPSPGLMHLKNQKDRAKAYRVYTEDAAVNPYCVGVHYFTLYDESALGRFDGENYNIGFLDVCNKPYNDFCEAAKTTHEKIYKLADESEKPFTDAPEYLPRLF